MPFEPGAPRPEKGGRKAGTPNKRNAELLVRAREMGADPAEYLMKYIKGDVRELGYEDRLIKRQREYEIAREKHEKKRLASPNPDKIEPYPELRELTEAEKHEINMLPADARKDAAKEFMPYVYGKRVPTNSDGDDSDPYSQLLDMIDANR
jgi:hypothetical protein